MTASVWGRRRCKPLAQVGEKVVDFLSSRCWLLSTLTWDTNVCIQATHPPTYIHIYTKDNSNTDGRPTIPKALNSATPHFLELTPLYIQVSLRVLPAVSENSPNGKAQVPNTTSTSRHTTPFSCICNTAGEEPSPSGQSTHQNNTDVQMCPSDTLGSPNQSSQSINHGRILPKAKLKIA